MVGDVYSMEMSQSHNPEQHKYGAQLPFNVFEKGSKGEGESQDKWIAANIRVRRSSKVGWNAPTGRRGV